MKRILLSLLTISSVLPFSLEAKVPDPESYFVGSNIVSQFRCDRMKKHATGLTMCRESFDATPTSNMLPDRSTYFLVKAEQNSAHPDKNHVHFKGYYHQRKFIDQDMPKKELSGAAIPRLVEINNSAYLIGNIQFTYSVREASTESVHTYAYYSVQRLK
ncbi:hypothetical protein [Vibrio owensii]|uniref:hypothetical protein n=1 Tax=Vibrio harveyi group TaxID=717610 RepID=UPI003CC5105B